MNLNCRQFFCLLLLGASAIACAQQDLPGMPPQMLEVPKVNYPLASRRYEEEGGVLLRISVTPAGSVQSAAVLQSSGYPRLDAAALEYAQSLRYSSATDPGATSQDRQFNLPIVFKLDPATAPRDPRVRGAIGVAVAPLSDESAQDFSLPKGALVVTDLRPGASAERHGLLVGDIVLKINDWPSTSIADFMYVLARTRTGASITLDIFRRNIGRRVVVPVEQIPATGIPQ